MTECAERIEEIDFSSLLLDWNIMFKAYHTVCCCVCLFVCLFVC